MYPLNEALKAIQEGNLLRQKIKFFVDVNPLVNFFLDNFKNFTGSAGYAHP